MRISMANCQDGYLSSFIPLVKMKQNWKNNPYGLYTISALVYYLEDFESIMKISIIY